MSSRAPRKFGIKPPTAMNSDINVTPLVDVVLVLLIIFMVVTPLLEKDIPVRVPESEKVEQVVELPKNQLLVRIEANGDLRLGVGQAESPVALADLTNELRKHIEARTKPEDKVVFIISDDAANYGGVVTVLDRAKQAGAEVLGMMTEKPEDKEKEGAPPP